MHFNSVWSSGISPWLFSGKNDAVVRRKKELLTPIISKIESDYVLLVETKIDYTRFKIPLRWSKYIMNKVSQTHKNILIFKSLKQTY